LVQQQVYVTRSGSDDNFGYTRLLRGSTELTTLRIGFFATRGNNASSYAYLDSPATTSSTTYKTQGKGDSANSNFSFQNESSAASIVLLEIGA